MIKIPNFVLFVSSFENTCEGVIFTTKSLRGSVIPAKAGIQANWAQTKPDRGRGTAFAVPALRTVRAVLPHTALQSVVSSSGLAR